MSRVCIIGLDCLTPQLLFDQYSKVLPNFESIVKKSVWGPLKSTTPPITIPAWACMVTGSSPGILGSYGFRTRKNNTYKERKLPSSLGFPVPTLWQLTSDAGLFNRILTVPQTYPALPLQGELIAGFPIADPCGPTSYPRNLGQSIKDKFPDFQVDIEDYRTRSPKDVLAEIHRMTNARFQVAEHWLRQDDWSLFMMVEMGPDRLHHIFWHYAQPDHPDFVPEHSMRFAIRDYYILLDSWLGKLTKHLRPNDLLLIVSDHGAQTMKGGFAINQWLVDNGYLALLDEHPRSGPLQLDLVDWARTKMWADGGYVGRIYFNIENREPKGTITEQDAQTMSLQLQKQWSSLLDRNGTQLNIKVLSPTQAYGNNPRGFPPDLTLILNDLSYRALGTLGHPNWFSSQNDTGQDGANHAQNGICICHGPNQEAGYQEGLDILDIAPTVLDHLAIDIPQTMAGTPISRIRTSRTKDMDLR